MLVSIAIGVGLGFRQRALHVAMAIVSLLGATYLAYIVVIVLRVRSNAVEVELVSMRHFLEVAIPSPGIILALIVATTSTLFVVRRKLGLNLRLAIAVTVAPLLLGSALAFVVDESSAMIGIASDLLR